MFRLFNNRKNKANLEKFDPGKITVHYEGSVIFPEYAAETLDRTKTNNQNYPWYNLFPHSHVKVTLVDVNGGSIEEFFREHKFLR
jgi:hypothetical protein